VPFSFHGRFSERAEVDRRLKSAGGTMSMSKTPESCIKVIVAALGLAAALASSPLAAADLAYRDGAPYDDPRYSDIYRHPAPPPPVYREEHYVPPPPAPPPRRYGHDVRPSGCTPQHVIRDRLESRGWHDFHDPQVRGDVVHIRARRHSGREFDLTVDRCTGEVLGAELIDRRAAQVLPPPGDWRYGERPFGRY
jgi:hypothetical protein